MLVGVLRGVDAGVIEFEDMLRVSRGARMPDGTPILERIAKLLDPPNEK